MRYVLVVLAFIMLVPSRVVASASPQAVAVLDQEHRWIQAAATRDAKLLGTILADNFVHTNYRGIVSYREQELANVTKPKPYTEATSEQTVDFAAPDVAVVHGLNTISQAGKVVLLLRYTDVYVKQDGRWMALSAQETPVTK
ncbi:MAG TPA: nuclear transport factor 2 family protein [Candidatus Aquilonibacter sp.]